MILCQCINACKYMFQIIFMNICWYSRDMLLATLKCCEHELVWRVRLQFFKGSLCISSGAGIILSTLGDDNTLTANLRHLPKISTMKDTPWKINGWNPKITQLKNNIIFPNLDLCCGFQHLKKQKVRYKSSFPGSSGLEPQRLWILILQVTVHCLGRTNHHGKIDTRVGIAVSPPKN